MSMLRKRASKWKKTYEFYLGLEVNLHYYFHATWALLEDFEIFDNFDHIFTLLLTLFRPLKVDMTPLGQNFENFDHFDHIFYLIFSDFSTLQSRCDPVGPKIWIANTSMRPLDHSWAENNGVGNFFGHQKWGLKTKKTDFSIFGI